MYLNECMPLSKCKQVDRSFLSTSVELVGDLLTFTTHNKFMGKIPHFLSEIFSFEK